MSSREPPRGETSDPGDPAPEAGAFARALASALQKWMMYPSGHEALEPALDALVEASEEVLRTRDELELRLSEGRLLVQDSPVDPENPVLGGLARRLHDEQLRSLAFRTGVGRDELAGLLERLAEASASEEALGSAGEGALPDGPHLAVEPFRYERLRLDERPEEAEGERRPDGRARELLAEAGSEEIAARLSSSLEGAAPDSAEAVEELVELMASAGAEEEEDRAEELRRKVSEVVLRLDADVLAELAERARANGEEARMLRAAADRLDLEAVRRLVNAAAASREGGIADWLLRLLTKLSQYGSSDEPDPAASHRREVRETVERIIENWDLEDPRPQPYSDQLDDLARRPPEEEAPEPRELEVEPERLVAMGLEMDEPAPPVEEASRQLVDSERFSELSSFLRLSPGDSQVGKLLWSQLSVPRVVRKLLEAEAGPRELLDRIVLRSGVDVAPPLLDALAEPKARKRSFRDRVIDLLCRIGEPVASLVPDRLDSPEPFVRSNLLRLLTALAVLPPNFSPLAYMDDPDPGVRVKAFQIASDREEHRPEAIRRALEDEHLKLVSLALQEAETAFPPSAEELVVGHVRNEELPESVRIHAVRALGEHGSEAGLEALVELVWVRRMYFWRKLAPPSPLVLEALGTLARRWPDDPRARPPLEAARASDHPEVREAVSVGGNREG